MNTPKQRAATLSIFSNTLLALLKLTVGIATGAASIVAEAIHSLTDLIASIVTLASVRISDQPPDDNHPFGHGKFEDLAGLFEATLILLAAYWIIQEAVLKLMHPHNDAFHPLPGLIVMAISVIVNWFVSRILFQVAKETHSTALEADAHHLSTDILSSLAIFIGLATIQFTGLYWLDPIIALGVAALIIRLSWGLYKKVFRNLVDTALSPEEEGEIRRVIEAETANRRAVIDGLKAVRHGSRPIIHFNLLLPGDISLETVHELCDHLEAVLETHFPGALVMIHPEPIACAVKQPTEIH